MIEKRDIASVRLQEFREDVDSWWERQRFRIYLTVLLLLLTFAFMWHRIFVTIPAGHQGVMFRRFSGGTVVEDIWGEGFHIIPPWDRMTVYETRVQEKRLTFPVLSEDGLEMDITVSVRFQPIIAQLGFLHQDVGPDYFDRLISPEIQAHLRRVIGDRSAFELYSTEGDILQEATRVDIEVQYSQKYVRLDELLIKKIRLPAFVRAAIEEKHRQQELLREYEYRLARAEKEAERKRIEAAGIRDYNAIARNISADLLRWRGIDATLELAKSQNSKLVIIGGGKDGLPIILDTSTMEASGAPSPDLAENPTFDTPPTQ